MLGEDPHAHEFRQAEPQRLQFGGDRGRNDAITRYNRNPKGSSWD